VNAGAGLLLAVLVAGLAEMAVFRRRDGWLVGGIVYAGLSGLSLAAIRGSDMSGLIAMLFLFAVVWATDICAFFIGRALRGPKLAPSISPGKTWSGAIGGTICAVIAGTLVYAAFFGMDGPRIPVLALLLSICSQIGDLGDSFIKRRFGVKDSSRLIPGHGGVMDRVDGLVFACFAAFIVILGEALILGGAGMPAGALLLGR
jgi:phosphatidate cytidylyltransferase